MGLSDALRKRAEAIEQTPNYRGPDLRSKIIIGLEGPFGAGKSTLADKCIAMLQEVGINAGIIGTNTTRESRPNDPDHYTTEIDPELLIKSGENGELINLTPFPTGHLYGTSAKSIPWDVNIGPLMPAAINKFRDAGCKEVFAFYLTMPPQQWQKQLDLEKRLERPDAAQRLDDAIESLEDTIHLVENSPKGTQILVNNDGDQSIEQLAGNILCKAGFKQFEKYKNDSKDQLKELYDYAVYLRGKVEKS